MKAGELYYSSQLLEPEGMIEDQEFTVTDNGFQNADGDKLEISGSLPSSGKVTVTSDGKVALAISNGEYCIQKATSESKVEAVKQTNCTDYKKTANPVFTISDENASIPACIIDNTECSAGTPVAVKVNNTDEPLDFYVMSDNTSENEITLIMNKNLGGTVAWASEEDYGCGKAGDYCSTNDKGPITALKALEERTSSWTNIPYSKYDLKGDGLYTDVNGKSARARLITYSEATGQGCEDYNSDTCPDWLYKNTYNHGDNTNYGYWTSSAYADSSIYAWVVDFDGSTSGTSVYTDSSSGVRPVITISKTTI